MKKTVFKILFLFSFLCGYFFLAAQDEKPEPQINLRYFSSNNSVQWLEIKTTIKANNKIEPVKNFAVQVYIDSIYPANKLASLRTDEKGFAKTFFPITLKEKWNANTEHKFLAVANAATENAVTAELTIGRAKIILDTVNEDDVRSVKAEVLFYAGGMWLPAKDVELKIGVQRLGGAIRIGEEETYTTDSLGIASGEFKMDSLPAIDKLGNITLVGWTEDNELFGNISFEKKVPWGRYYQAKNNFGDRSLWATRDKAPIWLLASAFSIIASVWLVVIYLIWQVIKIRKLGRQEEELQKPLKNIPKVVH